MSIFFISFVTLIPSNLAKILPSYTNATFSFLLDRVAMQTLHITEKSYEENVEETFSYLVVSDKVWP